MDTATETTRTSAADIDPAAIIHQSDMATACLVMASIHADFRDGRHVVFPCYPWDVLDMCANLRSLGAVGLHVWQGRHMGKSARRYEDTWGWTKPTRKRRA